MPIRNPFKKNAPGLESEGTPRDLTSGFQTTHTTGAKPIDIKEPLEYKLSEINDSGVYLPPSPPEKQSRFWTPSRTSTSSNYRGVLSENEPFNISRESFDSYRRSFDISARAPISDLDINRPRASLDSRRVFQQRPPRSSLQDRRIDRPEHPVEEGFEEVGLNDEKPQRKRGLFSRFSDSHNENAPPSSVNADGRPNSSGHHGFLFTGRKRGQSGKGEELRSIPNRPSSRNAVTVSAE